MHKPDIYQTLDYFSRSEFNEPDHMDYTFLKFLDRVRGSTDIKFLLTSDGRGVEHNARIGGAKNSLHLFNTDTGRLCRAVDFVFPAQHYVGRGKWKDFWKLTASVMATATGMEVNGLSLLPYVQFEIVHSKADRHFHLALFRDPVGPELIVAAD